MRVASLGERGRGEEGRMAVLSGLSGRTKKTGAPATKRPIEKYFLMLLVEAPFGTCGKE